MNTSQERQGLDAPDTLAWRWRNGRFQPIPHLHRIERLEEEKKGISDDIKDVYAEAKANGFDTKALRAVIRLRKQEATERNEQQMILETYMHALGMLAA